MILHGCTAVSLHRQWMIYFVLVKVIFCLLKLHTLHFIHAMILIPKHLKRHFIHAMILIPKHLKSLIYKI